MKKNLSICSMLLCAFVMLTSCHREIEDIPNYGFDKSSLVVEPADQWDAIANWLRDECIYVNDNKEAVTQTQATQDFVQWANSLPSFATDSAHMNAVRGDVFDRITMEAINKCTSISVDVYAFWLKDVNYNPLDEELNKTKAFERKTIKIK